MELQGYLAQKNPPIHRTLQWPYALGPMFIIWGWVFLMREVPLYAGGRVFLHIEGSRSNYEGAPGSLHSHRFTVRVYGPTS